MIRENELGNNYWTSTVWRIKRLILLPINPKFNAVIIRSMGYLRRYGRTSIALLAFHPSFGNYRPFKLYPELNVGDILSPPSECWNCRHLQQTTEG